MRIPSGVTDQYIYFVAVDSTDYVTRETGFSTWTVYRSRNGGAAAAMTTPTINETDTTNMPGVYELLLDEDMTIDAGDDSQEMAFHITHAGMAPVTRTIELYRSKITAGNTLDVTATGAAGIDWGNVENKTTVNDLSATDIQLCDTVTTNTDMVGTDNAATAANLATAQTDLDTITGADGALVATGAVTAAAIATDAVDADSLAADAVLEIADNILARDIGSGTNALTALDERTVRSALRFLRNKFSIAGGTLTVTTENDTTTAWTAAVTTDAAADPITANDPT